MNLNDGNDAGVLLEDDDDEKVNQHLVLGEKVQQLQEEPVLNVEFIMECINEFRTFTIESRC